MGQVHWFPKNKAREVTMEREKRKFMVEVRVYQPCPGTEVCWKNLEARCIFYVKYQLSHLSWV